MASEQNAEVRKLWEDLVTSLEPTTDHTPGVDEFRANYEKLCSNFPVPGDAEFERYELGGVPVISCLDRSAMGDAVILYFHGGGYVIGTAEGYRSFGAALSKVSGSKVVLVDYRLAPEHPFPAAVDDGVAAFEALLEEGLQDTDITVAGDSAGGGLAAAVMLALKDTGSDLPAGAVLFSPWADLTLTAGSIDERAEADPIVSRDMLSMLGGLYLGDADPSEPRVSPVHGNLEGLPPMLIFVGSSETLHDDSQTLANRAEAAGVDVTLEVGEDLFHVYPCFCSMLPEGQEAVDRAGRFIAEMTNTPTIT